MSGLDCVQPVIACQYQGMKFAVRERGTVGASSARPVAIDGFLGRHAHKKEAIRCDYLTAFSNEGEGDRTLNLRIDSPML
jgi:hypothetical protein